MTAEADVVEWTLDQYAAHFRTVAEKYMTAAIFIRGDLTAWKHERSVQAADDADCEQPPSSEYYRADGAINAINQLAFRADRMRQMYEEIAAAAERGDKNEFNRLRSELRNR